MSGGRKRLLAGTAGAVLAALAVAAPAADAAPEQQSHCSLNLDTGTSKCYATFGAMQSALSAAGEVKQGTFYDDRDYGGASHTVVGDGLCDGSDGKINYQVNLPEEWFDRISSAQPWGDCKLWLYPEVDLGGERDGPFEENAAYVGDFMNDRTKSVGFS